jgi:CBS domain-containing protein
MDSRRAAMNVSNVMTREVDYIAADDTVREAARRMQRLGTVCLAVVTDSEAVGMITDRDIVLRAVARGFDPAETPVETVMTGGLVVCREDDSLDIAARMMARRRLRQLVVINAKGQLSGIVSVGVLAEHMKPAAAARLLKTLLA